jgi:hypothetical protein
VHGQSKLKALPTLGIEPTFSSSKKVIPFQPQCVNKKIVRTIVFRNKDLMEIKTKDERRKVRFQMQAKDSKTILAFKPKNF